MAWERAIPIEKGPKVLIVGPTGCYKTRTVMRAGHVAEGAPRLLLLDYEDGGDLYRKEFNFSCTKIQQVINLSDPYYAITEQEIVDLKADRHVYLPILNQGFIHGVDFARVILLNRVAKNPIDFIVVDPITTHYSWIMDKWLDIFLKREVSSKGYKRDYYTMQPRDYDKPKREFQSFVSRLQAVDTGVFIIAHEKPEYAEGEIMKKIGMTADVHKSLPYKMDVHIHIQEEEAGKAQAGDKRHTKYIAYRKKDRTNSLEERFVWVNKDACGWSPYFITKMEALLNWSAGGSSLQGDDPLAMRDEADAVKTHKSADPTRNAKDGKVSDDQLRRLAWLKQELNISNEVWKGKILAKREVVTARHLLLRAADELIARLRERLSAKSILFYRVELEGKNGPPQEEKAPEAAGFQAAE